MPSTHAHPHAAADEKTPHHEVERFKAEETTDEPEPDDPPAGSGGGYPVPGGGFTDGKEG